MKVKKAVNLSKKGSPDPYVKMVLYHKEKPVKKFKTDTQKNTQNPVFNHTQSFDLDQVTDLKSMTDLKLELTVMVRSMSHEMICSSIAVDCLVAGRENLNAAKGRRP